MPIQFHEENVNADLKEIQEISEWIEKVIIAEKGKPGELNIILTDDEYLRGINREYLSRDYYTDIITFDVSIEDEIGGDLFISLERVRENALEYNQSWEDELKRVIVHGILHLAGYDDRTEQEKMDMRQREDLYLEQYRSKL